MGSSLLATRRTIDRDRSEGRPHRVLASSSSSSSSSSDASAPPAASASASASGRGGGTPGSWNLGVAHSDASARTQREYVDELFKAYASLVAAARSGDVGALARVLETDAYAADALDASTRKIRDAQLGAAAKEACDAGEGKTLEMLFERVDLRTPPDAFAPSVVNSELMHRAAREGHDLVLELLIEKCGGDVNAREEDGTSTVTVLMAAAARGADRVRREVRSYSHWSPYDRDRVVNAVP